MAREARAAHNFEAKRGEEVADHQLMQKRRRGLQKQTIADKTCNGGSEAERQAYRSGWLKDGSWHSTTPSGMYPKEVGLAGTKALYTLGNSGTTPLAEVREGQ